MSFSSSLFEGLNFTEQLLSGSTLWLRVANVFCVLGAALCVGSAFRHIMLAASRGSASPALALPGGGQVPAGGGGGGAGEEAMHERGAKPSNLFRTLSIGALFAAIVAMSISVWNRYLEVNHFPSQTMSEVVVMFSFALIVSMAVLVFALGLNREGAGWAVVGDAILLLVLLGAWATNAYSTTLSTAQRDLPPALQSYWFPPHLVALIFSYGTMAITGTLCAVYFSMRFWGGVFRGGRTIKSQLFVVALLTLVPFAQILTIPILGLVGLIFLGLWIFKAAPGGEWMAAAEDKMDRVSYKAFAVGFPFLTAGLFMGAFWAQEAWANYWGWDSKENSALITWLVYVIYVHLRMLGGYRGEKAMAVLLGGALSVFLTFQIFGYLPDSQKSLHRYTDDGVTPTEGTVDIQETTESARVESR